jgi:hypothetical protein
LGGVNVAAGGLFYNCDNGTVHRLPAANRTIESATPVPLEREYPKRRIAIFTWPPRCFTLPRMKDLTNPSAIKLKGLLFLFLGLFSATLLLLEHPSLKVALLLALCIWCFCRAYYFAFYVIERYVDPAYRFSGLWSCARYLLQKRRKDDHLP